MSRRPLLILDLDETLIHTTREWIGHPPDFTCEGAGFVFIRPGLPTFLDRVRGLFDLAIWTAATQEYLDCIIANVLNDTSFTFTWCRDHCTKGTYPDGSPLFIKDLRAAEAAGYDLDRVVAVDDRPEALRYHPRNLVSVKPYFGGRDDCELAALTMTLERHRTVGDQ